MNQYEQRTHDQLRADQAVINAAAGELRDDQRCGRLAGLDRDTAWLLAGLLEVLADDLPALPRPVREHTARVCREFTGAPMDQPTRRRTRRR